nr:LysR substrate-binding domain-containing protein [Pseudovibrio flavus]
MLFDAREIELGFYDQHVISGELSLGASQTAAEHLIPDLISNIDGEFPELRINLEVRNTSKVIEGVRDYEYELGIIEGRCDDSRLHQEVWCRDHLVIFVSKHHPFATLEKVSLSQLEQAKWVLREPGSGTRRIFDSAIHGFIDDLDVWREYEHVPVLRTLVANGRYVSCLPFLDVEKYIERGEFVALNVPEIKIERTLSFVWRANSVDNPLRDCLIREAKRLVKLQHRQLQVGLPNNI